ncbi:hypothetical protein TNCT_187571 [Trichonephila clavata]|uniref:Uncharacterized protein n=1 Tax=Trichonephila clavata TaxID=2740835 RepID=A0A8X6GC54_TRICU|nr:hypothetical protein TNCT_187571 [Trichonephila clavata]
MKKRKKRKEKLFIKKICSTYEPNGVLEKETYSYKIFNGELDDKRFEKRVCLCIMAQDERQLQVSNFSPKFSLHDIISRAAELGKIENVVTETSAGNSGLESKLLACFIKFKDGSIIPLAEASSNFPGCYVKYKFNGTIRKKEARQILNEDRSDLAYLTSSCFDSKKKILDQIAKDVSKDGEVKYINAYGNPDKYMYIAVHQTKSFTVFKAAVRAGELHYETVFDLKHNIKEDWEKRVGIEKRLKMMFNSNYISIKSTSTEQ